MTISKRLRLAVSVAPILCALTVAIPAQAAPPSGGNWSGHHDGGHGDFHGHDHFGFGYGFGDPWWGWGWDSAYWGYPYYPDYYPPYPAYYAPPPGYAPAPGAAPPAAGQAGFAPPAQSWYYCDSPQGYYPYVQSCGTTWKQVAATPPSSGSTNTITPKR